MRKMISLILCTVLVFALAVSANAASGSVLAGASSAKPGDTVTFTFSFSSGDSTTILTVQPSYCQTCFSLVSGSYDSSNAQFYDFSNGVFSAYGKEETVLTGTGTLTLKVNPGAIQEHSCSGVGGVIYVPGKDGVGLSSASVTITHDHVWGEWTETKAATCGATGVKTRTCGKCGKTETETSEKLAHTPGDWETSKEATCTEAGEKVQKCTVCGNVLKTEEIPAKGHTLSEDKKITKAPTCTETGTATGVCSVCGTEMGETVLDALGHDWEKTSEVKPTCEKAGSRTYTCKNDPSHTKTEDDEALGHSWGEWEQTKAPTCTEDGKEERVCANDPTHKETRSIPATGHTPSEKSEITKAPTCEETGLLTGKCSVCGAKLKDEVIPALGHDWEMTSEVKPTCEEAGSKSYTCKNDATHTKTEKIDALGHSWSKWTENSETGKHERTCSVCGKTESADHSWDKGTVTRPPCVVDGEKTYTCADCGAKKTEVIPASSDGTHNITIKNEFNTYGKNETTHWLICQCGEKGEPAAHQYTQEGPVLVKPTTTKEGKQIKYCVCGAETTVTLPKVTANYDNVPKTGDITGQLVLGGGAVCVLLVAALLLLKRKLAK